MSEKVAADRLNGSVQGWKSNIGEFAKVSRGWDWTEIDGGETELLGMLDNGGNKPVFAGSGG
jgi:hypothetical protein